MLVDMKRYDVNDLDTKIDLSDWRDSRTAKLELSPKQRKLVAGGFVPRRLHVALKARKEAGRAASR